MSWTEVPASGVPRKQHDNEVASSTRDIMRRLLWAAQNHGFGTRVATRIEKGEELLLDLRPAPASSNCTIVTARDSQRRLSTAQTDCLVRMKNELHPSALMMLVISRM